PSKAEPVLTAATPQGTLSWPDVIAFRAGSNDDGFITGSPRSVQFQVYPGKVPHIWGIAIGTRHVERAYERCLARGIPCTDIQLVPWTDGGGIRAFFAEVAGIIFEVLRVEESATS